MTDTMMGFADALSQTPYSLKQAEKDVDLLKGLNELSRHHYENCAPYQRIVDGLWDGQVEADRLEDVPHFPVSLFKRQKLLSAEADKMRMTLTSSGTTGAQVSQIFVDAETSTRQQKGLANSLGHILGPKRLPMLVIDTADVFKNPKMMSARGAGVLGIMRYGRNHAFALQPDLSPDIDAVKTFLEELDGQPFFMFGFTFMVWLRLYEQFKDAGLDLSQGILVHSGGWKKMVEQAVDPAVFKQKLTDAFGLTKVYNFYGMVEQIGSVFLEGPNDLLYPPNFSDVIIRNPNTWQPCEVGEAGVIQVLSLLPLSYPGHSLLTEDIGVVEAIDAGENGWNGKGIRIIGRVPKAELRGCSDVIGEQVA